MWRSENAGLLPKHVLHAVKELLGAYKVVAVGVHLLHDGSPQTFVVGRDLVQDMYPVEVVFQFLPADEAVSVFVDQLKSARKILKRKQAAFVDCRANELPVVDPSVVVGVELGDEHLPVI